MVVQERPVRSDCTLSTVCASPLAMLLLGTRDKGGGGSQTALIRLLKAKQKKPDLMRGFELVDGTGIEPVAFAV